MSRNTDEKRFRELRSKFSQELEDLEREIGKLEVRRQHLIDLLEGGSDEEGTHLHADRVQDRYFDGSEESLYAVLLKFLGDNPGASRQAIRELFDGRLSESQQKNLIEWCRKQGMIENRGGSKGKPAWFVIDKQ